MRYSGAILLLATLSLPGMAVWAGPAHMVADLDPRREAYDTNLAPAFSAYAAVNGRAVFFGTFEESSSVSYQQQCGLWVTDGSPGGTGRLADLCGAVPSFGTGYPRVGILANNGSLALFADSAKVVWRTDGTAAGTYPVAQGVEATEGWAAPDGGFLFTGCAPATGCDPWRSDGTIAGTRRIRDLSLPAGVAPGGYTAAGRNRAVFRAGGGLWITDGTAAGTLELFRPPRFTPSTLVVKGRQVLVLAAEGGFYGTGYDLWTVDLETRKARRLRSFIVDDRHDSVRLFQRAGRVLVIVTQGGTSEIWEVADASRAGVRRLGPPSTFKGEVDDLYEVRGRILFGVERAGGRLWALDPGRTAFRSVSAVKPLRESAAVSEDRLFFPAAGAAGGTDLWVSDGTAAGTRLLRTICDASCPVDYAVLTRPAPGGVLVRASDGDVWASDGTPEGTVEIARVPPPPGYTPPFDVATVGERAVFTGFDAVHGAQPWSTDLTPAGTARIADVGGLPAASSNPSFLRALEDELLFTTCSGNSGSVWVSDGTEAGTRLLPGTAHSCAYSLFADFTPVGEQAFFLLFEGGLWRTDGTPAGTVPLLDTPPGTLVSHAPWHGGLLFVPPPATLDGPWSFWTSDGTPAGTRDTGESPASGPPASDMLALGSDLFYVARPEGSFQFFVYRTDGTAAGTRPLFPLVPNPIQTPQGVKVGGGFVFIAQSGDEDTVLWASDGTTAGTRQILPAVAPDAPYHPREIVAFGGIAYFFAGSGRWDPVRQPMALWRTDGTAAGTRVVKVINPPSDDQTYTSFISPRLTVAAGRLFFVADDGVHGSELWTTDGTAAGTVLVKDIAPGPRHAHPGALTAAGGRLYFAATDDEHGVELWASDGTAAGTRLVQDIQPGPAPSNPEQLTAADGWLYFTADDGEHGREVWALPLPR